jgi:hypothetical protein
LVLVPLFTPHAWASSGVIVCMTVEDEPVDSSEPMSRTVDGGILARAIYTRWELLIVPESA